MAFDRIPSAANPSDIRTGVSGAKGWGALAALMSMAAGAGCSEDVVRGEQLRLLLALLVLAAVSHRARAAWARYRQQPAAPAQAISSAASDDASRVLINRNL